MFRKIEGSQGRKIEELLSRLTEEAESQERTEGEAVRVTDPNLDIKTVAMKELADGYKFIDGLKVGDLVVIKKAFRHQTRSKDCVGVVIEILEKPIRSADAATDPSHLYSTAATEILDCLVAFYHDPEGPTAFYSDSRRLELVKI